MKYLKRIGMWMLGWLCVGIAWAVGLEAHDRAVRKATLRSAKRVDK